MAQFLAPTKSPFLSVLVLTILFLTLGSNAELNAEDVGLPFNFPLGGVPAPKNRRQGSHDHHHDEHHNNQESTINIPEDRLQALSYLSDEAVKKHWEGVRQKTELAPVRFVHLLISGGGGGLARSAATSMRAKGRVFSPSELISSCDASVVEAYTINGRLSRVSPISHPQPLNPDENAFFEAASNGLAGIHPATRHYLISYIDPKTGLEVGHVFADPRVVAAVVHDAEHERKEPDGDVPAAPFGEEHEDNYNHPSTRATGLLLDYQESAYRSFRVPIGVKSLSLTCHGAHEGLDIPYNSSVVEPIVLHLPEVDLKSGVLSDISPALAPSDESTKRRFRQQDASNGIEVNTINYAGPADRTANIVFLSDGYYAQNKQAFFDKIDQIWDLLNALGNPSTNRDINNMHSSVPIDRYCGFWNVFAVFQPSNSEGIGDGAGKDTNLGCYRPQGMPRGIQCSVPKSLALAGVAPVNIQGDPDQTVIVVVANTNQYGGTGIYSRGYVHVGAFYNGDDTTGFAPNKYLSLINHETGHAMGQLFDEYDFGFTEPTYKQLLNCQAGSNGGPPSSPQWNHWISIFAGSQASFYRGDISVPNNENYGVLSTPQAVCGYSNYYKANSNCMMQYLNNYYMCPVCRESSLATIISLTNFEVQWPRFPAADNILLVPQTVPVNDTTTASVSTGVVLFLPGSLTTANLFTVVWKDHDGSTITAVGSSQCPQCAYISPSRLASYPVGSLVNITATITDNTNFLSPTVAASTANLKQVATFSIRIVPSVESMNTTYNGTKLTLPGSVIDRNSFGFYAPLASLSVYADCSNTNGCFLAAGMGGGVTGNVSYVEPNEPPKLLSDYESWIIIVVIAVGVLFILVWIIAACKFYSAGSRVARPIFKTKFSGVVKVIRVIMRMSSIAFMLASLGTIVIAIVFYVEVSAIGQVIIIAGVILAVFLYIMAFVGFWAITSRVKRLTIANAIVLAFGAACLITLAVIIFTIGNDIKTEDSFWTKKINEGWQALVEAYPERACAIQDMLGCSGFLLPCNGVSPSTLYCPSGCDDTNRDNGTPCRGKVEDYISDNYYIVLIIVIVAGVMMLLAITFNAVYLVSLSRMKKEIRERHTQRVYNHARKHGVNTDKVSHAKALHILKTLDATDVNRLIKEFFRIDVNGDGEIDKSEMTVFFRRALCHPITKIELDELYEVADLDGNGAISLEEFLIIFNHKMPSIEENPDAYKFAFKKQDTVQDVGQNLNRMRSNLKFNLQTSMPMNVLRRTSLFGKSFNSEGTSQSEEMASTNFIGGDSPPSIHGANSAGRRGSSVNGTSFAGTASFAYNQEGMEKSQRYFGRVKTEDELVREIELRKRAQSRLASTGLYTDEDRQVGEELERNLEELRRNKLNLSMVGTDTGTVPNDSIMVPPKYSPVKGNTLPNRRDRHHGAGVSWANTNEDGGESPSPPTSPPIVPQKDHDDGPRRSKKANRISNHSDPLELNTSTNEGAMPKRDLLHKRPSLALSDLDLIPKPGTAATPTTANPPSSGIRRGPTSHAPHASLAKADSLVLEPLPEKKSSKRRNINSVEL